MSSSGTGSEKFGARIYYLDDGVILVKQTSRKEGKGDYTLTYNERGSHRERHVNKGDERGLVAAILAAGRGEL